MWKIPTIVIIKSSPWKLAHFYKNHPEYMAIFQIIQCHKDRARFILIGNSDNRTASYHFENGVIAWDIKSPRVRRFGHITYNLELLMIFFRYKPHLIIVFGNLQILSAAIFSLISLKSKYVPIFIGEFTYFGRNIIGGILHKLYFKAMSIMLQLSQKKAIEMFTLSRYERESINRLAPRLKGKIRLVSYPISPLFSTPPKKPILIDKKHPVILTVAGLEPRKGIDTLIEAIKLIPRKLQLVIKGQIRDLIYTQKLKLIIKKLKLDDSVKFITEEINYNSLVHYYRSATIFVLPTREDCLGVVLLEALHSDLPVIATSVGGIPDMIKNGENGLLVKPNNPVELAKAILLLLDNNELRENLSKNAKKVLLEHYYKGRITLKEALNESIKRLFSFTTESG